MSGVQCVLINVARIRDLAPKEIVVEVVVCQIDQSNRDFAYIHVHCFQGEGDEFAENIVANIRPEKSKNKVDKLSVHERLNIVAFNCLSGHAEIGEGRRKNSNKNEKTTPSKELQRLLDVGVRLAILENVLHSVRICVTTKTIVDDLCDV